MKMWTSNDWTITRINLQSNVQTIAFLHRTLSYNNVQKQQTYLCAVMNIHVT